MNIIGVVVGTVAALASVLVILISVVLLIIASVRNQPRKPMLISGLSGIGALIISFTLLAIGAASDTSISKEDYDSLSEVYRKTSSELEEIKSENIKLSRDYDELQEEYDEFKSKAEPFMKLSEEEQAAEIARAEQERLEAEEAARAAQEEADRVAAEKAAEEEAKRQAEEEARLAEEAKGYDTGITYKDLARSPETYEGQKVKFTGTVLQVIEGSMTLNGLRLATKDSYDDVVYCEYLTSILDVRLLEDDIITIYGISNGLQSYETVMGATVTLPKISVIRIDIES